MLFLALVRRGERNLRFAAFGFAWLMVTLVPVLNAHWMASNVFAERYLYLSSAGFCWALAGAFSWLWHSTTRNATWRRALLAGSLALVAFATLRIAVRNRDWRDDVTLYTRTLQQSARAYPILNNLGTVYWQDGRIDNAEAVWRQALAVNPGSAIVLNNLGLVAGRRQQYASAADLFKRASELKPEFFDPHLNLGSAERALGFGDAAEAEFRRAIALSPLNDRAHQELGELLLDEGRLIEAAGEFRASVRATPTIWAYDDLGEAGLRLKNAAAAEQAWRAALGLDRFDSRARFNLGALYSAQGRRREALDEYRAGLLTDPHNAGALAAISALESPAGSQTSGHD